MWPAAGNLRLLQKLPPQWNLWAIFLKLRLSHDRTASIPFP